MATQEPTPDQLYVIKRCSHLPLEEISFFVQTFDKDLNLDLKYDFLTYYLISKYKFFLTINLGYPPDKISFRMAPCEEIILSSAIWDNKEHCYYTYDEKTNTYIPEQSWHYIPKDAHIYLEKILPSFLLKIFDDFLAEKEKLCKKS